MNLFTSDKFFIASSLVSAFLMNLALTESTSVERRESGRNGVKNCRDNSGKLLPDCTRNSYRINQEATCSPLNSMSRAATCSRFNERVSCQSPVLQFTKAKISCRLNYGPDPIFSPSVEQEVECSPNGVWSPKPITCSPECGAVYHHGPEQLTINETPREVHSMALPWHAEIWKEITTPQGSEMRSQCSATIVDTNLVITTAGCVIGGKAGTSEDSRRLRVTVGNAYRGSILHKVKNVYTYCKDSRQDQGYVSDIALVELLDPIGFSTAVLPACLDVSTYNERDFGPGVSGRVDGFSRQSVSSDTICQTVEATHMSTSECRVPNNPTGSDQFCAVHSKESCCHWNSGGGFVASKGGLWHLIGIFIKDLGMQGTETTCGKSPYSLYTKVSTYMAWIQDVMFQLARYKAYPPCKFQL